MGRIKTTLIKRTANSLIKEYPDRFTKNFDENKNLVSKLAQIHSKKIRNIVAGYITRLTRNKVE